MIAVTLLLSTITTFNSFGIIYLMTGGGPGGETRVYSILAYERAMLQNRFGPGAAVSLTTAPMLGDLYPAVVAVYAPGYRAQRAKDNIRQQVV